ncbi:type 1 glutamine amidotransferase [Natronoglycomyces albus]|uniref:Lipid II isoglutaminyl synthase (glutamine-hydrolyzing) subunit GatD n=1 Tax=Natronoglycomyces albus TaxID=2811108 RepID=A0A895XGB8_9ACTN|nr:glutamine amidotransferase [Natronoglycomyces albus]QSB03907.1 glutamine amidotransferase [Natronoglycomyces albus]
MSTRFLRIVWLYPDLLSTYGDRGNLLVLAHRARNRGIEVEPVLVRSDQRIPSEADIYLIGGGEDGPQAGAAERLISDGGLNRAADAGKPILAICAGYQILGSSFYASGQSYPGAGILDLHSDRGETRAVGEVAGEADAHLPLGHITGFENHGGRTHLGEAVQPLARVTHGIGNDNGSTEGAWAGHVIGTYMHGPALARNPQLADLLLSWATGLPLNAMPQLDDSWPQQLRKERFDALVE